MNIFEKYNKGIEFVVRNIIILLTGLLLLNHFNVLDITLLIPLRYYWVILLYLVSFFVFNYYQGCSRVSQERINTITKYVFLITLFFITLNFLNFVIQEPSQHLFPFNNMLIYLNHTLLISGIGLLVFNRNELNKIGKKESNKKFDWYKIAFFLIIILYLVIHLSMFKYPGGHADEYRHILSGKTLLEEGRFPIIDNIRGEKGYVRGAPISYLVAFFFYLFGFTVTGAKLVPISLGFINLLLLNKVSQFFIKDKKIRILSLLLFVCSSWLIYMHFLIRFYVFTEFSFVFVVFLFIKIIENLQYKFRPLFYSTLLVLINLINYFLMNDPSKYIIPFVTIFGILYIVSYELKCFNIKSKVINKFLKIKFKYKLIVLIALLLILLIPISRGTNLSYLLQRYLSGNTNTGTNHYNVKTFFLGLYLFFTTFLAFGFLSSISSINKKDKLLFYLLIPPMLLHYFSSTSMQIMRGMVYLLPIYYVGVSYGLEKLSKVFQEKSFKIVFFCLVLLSSVMIINNDRNLIFRKGHPRFPRELSYAEYSPMYYYIKENLEQYKLIWTEYSDQGATIYKVRTDYKLDFKGVSNGRFSTYMDSEGVIKQIYTNTPTITSRKEWYGLVSKENVCVILRNYANHFLEDSDIRRIKKNFELKESFINYEIYCKD